MLSLVSKSDAPPECVLAPLPASEDLSSGRLKDNDFHEVYVALSNGEKCVVVEAPTGSEISRECPNVIIKYMEDKGYPKPLLALSSANINAVGMRGACAYSSTCKREKRKRGIESPEQFVIYASPDLAARWCVNEGMKCFERWSGMFFDELHEAEYDMEYSFLWEAANQYARNNNFLLWGHIVFHILLHSPQHKRLQHSMQALQLVFVQSLVTNGVAFDTF